MDTHGRFTLIARSEGESAGSDSPDALNSMLRPSTSSKDCTAPHKFRVEPDQTQKNNPKQHQTFNVSTVLSLHCKCGQWCCYACADLILVGCALASDSGDGLRTDGASDLDLLALVLQGPQRCVAHLQCPSGSDCLSDRSVGDRSDQLGSQGHVCSAEAHCARAACIQDIQFAFVVQVAMWVTTCSLAKAILYIFP